MSLQNTLRVGIYLRLSNEDKDKANKDEPSESIKNQRNMLIDYINKHPEFTLIDEYSDEDLSGAGTYRPEFERLIKDCQNKKLDIVLCKSQSRFSRDMEIVEKYINNKFKEWNIRFIGLSDNADTLVLGNKKSRQINGLVNEWYLEDVSNNIRSAFKAKMKQGEYISPFAPFGYEISKENTNKLVIDPIASKIVKDIYNLYLTGYGFTGIAKHLNNKKIPCPSLYKFQKKIKLNIVSPRPREEIKWNANAIKTILLNEVYLGHLIQGKRTTVSYKNHKIKNKDKKEWIKKENTHEAIIDITTFNKVKRLMKERTKPTKNTKKVHIFSGKVFCFECNHHMRKKNSSKHEYLVCSNSENGYECPNKKSIRYDLLTDLILKEINKKTKEFYDPKILENLHNTNTENKFSIKTKSLENQKKQLKKEILKNKNYLKKIYEDKINEILTEEQFKYLAKEYTKKDNMYNHQIEYLNKEITNLKTKQLYSKNIHEIFKKYQNLKELNNVTVQEFIDKIYISKLDEKTKSRTIKIKWNLN